MRRRSDALRIARLRAFRQRGRHAARHRPHHRLRLPGDAADRAPRAGGRGVLRDPSVLESRRSVRQAEAQGGDPFRRAGVGSGSRQPARARCDLRKRRSDPRHLLRPADARRAARRQGRERACGRIRPRRRRDCRKLRFVRGRLADGRALSGVDEPRGPGDAASARFSRLRCVGERALRGRRGRRAPLLHHHVPPGGGPYARRREAHRQFPPQNRGPQGRLDDGRLPRRGDRPHPRASRQIAGHLRPLGRRRIRRSRRC